MDEPASDVPPPATGPRRWLRWWLLALPLGVAAGVLAGRALAASGTRFEAFRDASPLALVLGLPLILWLVLAVHEGGHLIAARLQGWPFLLLLVGPLRVVRGTSGLVWGFNRAWATWGGLTASIPPVDERFRRQMLCMVLAGPLASVALGAAVLLLARRGDALAAFGVVGGVTSLLIAVVTLLPMQGGGYQSDGAQALDLLRGGDLSRRRARRLALLMRGFAGLRPRDTDPAEVHASLDETADPRERLALWTVLLHIAMDRGAVEDGARAAHEVAALYHHFPDGMRQMVALDLAWFFGRHAGAATDAAAWLAQSAGGFVDPFQRPLAEAGLAWAEGRLEDARRAAAHARGLLPRAMDPGVAAAMTDQLAALDRDLDARQRRLPVP
ncbi:hypothetical protein [Luteitalea sp.]|uniref:hypothetical protein n=1 Tax=Luteitalea sp. TaxID=2004800 RepID=UPI0025C5DB3D|nr:hypothetical protein [Luteitalea sp.]